MKRATPADPDRANEGSAVEQHVRRILGRLTGESEASIRSERNLHLDLGVDSLMKLEIISELEAAFGFRCPEEKAAAVARVGDLVLLVGDRQPVGKKDGRGAAVGGWRQKLHVQRSLENGRRSAAASSDVVCGNVNGNGRAMWEPARRVARGGLSLFFHSYVRVRADGLEHVPADGPFVLAANHTSHLDSGTVLSAIGGRRRVWVVGAKDYFFNTATKRLVFGTLFDTIPFERNSEGLEGMRQCIEVLSKGDGVLFFPEGTRSTTGRLQTFRPGVAIMATEAEAPIVPVRIEHTFDLFPKGARMVRPGAVRVTFGEPIVVHAADVPSEMEAQYRWYRDVALRVERAVERLGSDRATPAEVAV